MSEVYVPEDGATKSARKPRITRLFATVIGLCVGAAIGVAIGLSVSSGSSSTSSAASTPTTPTQWKAETSGPGATTWRRRPVLVFVGDSITQMASDTSADGFVARLQYSYVRAADVLNRGVTVYNTKAFVSTALPVLEGEIATWLSPTVIAVWFGVNDATVVGEGFQSQHVDVDKYKKNLITILTRLHKAAPQAKLLLLTPATVDNGANLGRTNEETAKYAVACREVMDHVEGVTLLDMYKYLMETYPNAADRAKLQLDGLHFNSDGHKIVAEKLLVQIEKLLPGFSGGAVQVPEWDSLNDKYPGNKND